MTNESRDTRSKQHIQAGHVIYNNLLDFWRFLFIFYYGKIPARQMHVDMSSLKRGCAATETENQNTCNRINKQKYAT